MAHPGKNELTKLYKNKKAPVSTEVDTGALFIIE